MMFDPLRPRSLVETLNSYRYYHSTEIFLHWFIENELKSHSYYTIHTALLAQNEIEANHGGGAFFCEKVERGFKSVSSKKFLNFIFRMQSY